MAPQIRTPLGIFDRAKVSYLKMFTLGDKGIVTCVNVPWPGGGGYMDCAYILQAHFIPRQLPNEVYGIIMVIL